MSELALFELDKRISLVEQKLDHLESKVETLTIDVKGEMVILRQDLKDVKNELIIMLKSNQEEARINNDKVLDMFNKIIWVVAGSAVGILAKLIFFKSAT